MKMLAYIDFKRKLAFEREKVNLRYTILELIARYELGMKNPAFRVKRPYMESTINYIKQFGIDVECTEYNAEDFSVMTILMDK